MASGALEQPYGEGEGVSEYITMTRKQYEAVKLLARGLSDAEAAKELGVPSGSIHSRMLWLRKAMHRKSNEHLFYGLGLAAGRGLAVRFADEDESEEPRP